MGLVIFGLVLIAGAVGLFFAGRHNAERVFQIKRTQTSKIKNLAELAASVAKEIGPGGFHETAEVKGEVVCDQPLRSELAQAECAYYSFKVTREYEEKYWEKDSEGRQVQKTRRGSEIVASNERMAPFFVADDTGRIKVPSLEGASLDTVKSHSSFQPAGSNLRVGSFVLNLAGVGSNTLGYRYEESIIPLHKQIYILGEAVDTGGELAIQRPDNKKDMFIISLHSEEELIKSAQGAQMGFNIGSVIALIAGIGILIYGIVKGPTA